MLTRKLKMFLIPNIYLKKICYIAYISAFGIIFAVVKERTSF